MSDNTTYGIEYYDPTYGMYTGNPWVPVESVFDTFAEAQDAAREHQLVTTYRNVQVVKHVRSVVATYKDGVEVE